MHFVTIRSRGSSFPTRAIPSHFTFHPLSLGSVEIRKRELSEKPPSLPSLKKKAPRNWLTVSPIISEPSRSPPRENFSEIAVAVRGLRGFLGLGVEGSVAGENVNRVFAFSSSILQGYLLIHPPLFHVHIQM